MRLSLSADGLGIEQVLLAVGLVVVTELGYRLGRQRADAADEASRAQVTTVQASTLGLLALLLGFSLAMGDARFAQRRALILDEANAIGTTYLRAGFLPDGERDAVRERLRRYVDIRRAFFEARGREALDRVEAQAAEIHREVWALTERAVHAHPDWDVITAYVESLNEMIDLHAARRTALDARVPRTILVLVVVVAFVACGATGLGAGVTMAPRSALSLVVVPLLVAVSCAVVIDLDRPRMGLIHVNDGAMDRLAESLRAPP